MGHYPRRADPSPQEIAERAAEIREGWSESERLSRLRVDLRPEYRRCDQIIEPITAHDYQQHHDCHQRLTEGADDDGRK